MKTIHRFTSQEKLEFWGYGEWVEEPDVVLFKHKGLVCVVWRKTDPWKVEDCRQYMKVYKALTPEPRIPFPISIFGGGLNGYVRLPKGHPWRKGDYDDMDCDVHGGITFKDEMFGSHYIGFDCAHARDLVPSSVYLDAYIKQKMTQEHPGVAERIYNSPIFEKVYKNINYVMSECRSLADQVLENFKTEVSHGDSTR